MYLGLIVRRKSSSVNLFEIKNPLTSEINVIWSLISQISYLSYYCTYQLSDWLLQLLSFFSLLHNFTSFSYIFLFIFLKYIIHLTLISYPPKWVKNKCVSKCLNSSKTNNAMKIYFKGDIFDTWVNGSKCCGYTL